MNRNLLKTLVYALLLAAPVSLLAQGGALQVGYVVVTDEEPDTQDLSVFETFVLNSGGQTTYAEVLSSQMSTKGQIFVRMFGVSQDLGLAIVNPNNRAVTVQLTLRDSDGRVVATKSLPLGVRQQTAQLVSQVFATRSDITGTVTFESDSPVAVVGLRFRGATVSSVPLINLSVATAVPPLPAGAGGPGAFILPQVAFGDGWFVEIVVVNSSSVAHTVQVDLFKPDGSPLQANLNGLTASSFTNQLVPAGGVLVLSNDPCFGCWDY